MEPKIDEVCRFIRPEGGFITNGIEYEGIVFLECEPFTKEEYETAIVEYKSWKAQQEADAAAKKAAAEAKLAALGLTADDLKALGLG